MIARSVECGLQRWRREVGRWDRIETLREAAREEAGAGLGAQVAEPRGMSDTIGVCMDRAAKRLGWSYTRTEDVRRKDARRIKSFELDELRDR